MSSGTLNPNPNNGAAASPASIQRIELAWVSASDGSVNQKTPIINGSILRVSFVPDGGGTQPTNSYGVTLLDKSGIDVLGGAGSALSNTTASSTVPTVGSTGLPWVVAEPLTLVVANAGNAKGGTLVLYWRP